MSLDLAYTVTGIGPPVVILHGLYGSARNWRNVARKLSATHRVINVDLPNHGRSPAVGSMDYRTMAAAVLRVIERERLVAPALLGHCIGGKTALTLALLEPERIGSLIVVDVAPVDYGDHLALFTDVLCGRDALGDDAHTGLWRRLSSLMPQWGVENEDGVACLDWGADLPGIAASIPDLSGFPDELRTCCFAGPVRVIAGAHSRYVPEHDSGVFQPMFPETALIVLDDATHWAHVETPERFLVQVDAALRDAPADALADDYGFLRSLRSLHSLH
ncbi:alpha/beta fold hydrolase [Paraburkholderia flava]|uniref:alpha/beta fold hydrolase n=1 Tax=Paraburkholderia flava TaxID=2547393 RepID=UPI001414DF78|nr:alpha/beta fold hydrolase [Paraburkholderia flava]